MNNKSKITIGLMLLITHIGAYFLGAATNREKMLDEFERDFALSNANVNLGRYVEYRDVALSIKSGNHSRALCISRLGASAMYDDLQTCLQSKDCGSNLEREIRDAAPEILGAHPLGFAYIGSVDGIRTCD
jgi:hypothetical protein